MSSHLSYDLGILYPQALADFCQYVKCWKNRRYTQPGGHRVNLNVLPSAPHDKLIRLHTGAENVIPSSAVHMANTALRLLLLASTGGYKQAVIAQPWLPWLPWLFTGYHSWLPTLEDSTECLARTTAPNDNGRALPRPRQGPSLDLDLRIFRAISLRPLRNVSRRWLPSPMFPEMDGIN